MIAARTLWELIEARAAESPEALFAVDEGDRETSFGAYRAGCLRVAAGLAARGVGAGTRVSWQLPTRLDAMLLAGALARLAAVQNPILPIHREREVGFALRQCKTALLVVPTRFRGFDHAEMARGLAAGQPGLEVLVSDGALPEGDPAGLAPFAAPSGEPPLRWIFYTSGTTSEPKGALHTDATLLAAARGMCERLALRADDRIALVFPFTHVGGILWLMNGLLSGAGQIAVEAFDPGSSIEVLARHGVTQATAGTVFHQAYLAAQRAQGKEPLFPRVRSFPGGGAPKPPQLHRDIKREMGGAGIVSGYGLTECPVLAMNAVGDPDEKLAHTEGRASPAETEIRVVEGEIRVRAPQLCKGYLDEALNSEAFDAEGFFRTGDLGEVDPEGYVSITGRLKDVIIRKGENVSAKEIEDLLHRHPKVADVAVIGLPDPERGERVCAVVASRDPGSPLAFEEMDAFLREQGLMVQKLPEQLELVAELPRNPTGKVPKHELRARFAAAPARGGSALGWLGRAAAWPLLAAAILLLACALLGGLALLPSYLKNGALDSNTTAVVTRLGLGIVSQALLPQLALTAGAWLALVLAFPALDRSWSRMLPGLLALAALGFPYVGRVHFQMWQATGPGTYLATLAWVVGGAAAALLLARRLPFLAPGALSRPARGGK